MRLAVFRSINSVLKEKKKERKEEREREKKVNRLIIMNRYNKHAEQVYRYEIRESLLSSVIIA